MLFASHYLVFAMKQTPPTLDLLASAILSKQNMEKKSLSSTTGVSLVAALSHSCSDFVQFVVQRPNIRKQDAWQWRTMGLFPQAFQDSGEGSAVFLCLLWRI